MRRGRLVLILLLVLVLLLLCGALVYRFLSPAGLMGPAAQPTPETMETVTVVVTAQNIRRGQRITSELLATLEVPVQYVVETQILNPEEAVGKLAARDLPRGVFLTKGDLVETAADLLATGSLAALQIPPGYVAISIPITRLTSVSYAIQPGDRVGILVTLPFVDLDPEFQSRLPNLSASLVQNALLIGKGTEKPATAAPAAPGQEQGAEFVGGEALQTLVVQVVPGDAPLGRVETQEDFTLYTIPSELARPRLVSQMIVSDAMVLYVGTFPWQKPESLIAQQAFPAEGDAGGEQFPAPQEQQQAQPAPVEAFEVRPPDVVTLVVRPQDAVTLKYLMDRKVVFTLVLRSFEDKEPLSTEPVTLTYILEQYNIVVPSKQLFDLEPRIDSVDMPKLPNDVPLQPTPTP